MKVVFEESKTIVGSELGPFFMASVSLPLILNFVRKKKGERGSEIARKRESVDVRGWGAEKLRATHIAFQA